MSVLNEMLKSARDRGIKGSDSAALREFAIAYLRRHDMDPLRVILSHLGEQLGGEDESARPKRRRCPECLADMRLARSVRESGIPVPDSIPDDQYICVSCQLPGPG